MSRVSLSNIGERGLLDRVRRWCGAPSPKNMRTLVPLGDDAYVAKMSTNLPLVLTTDTLVEGTHFRLDWMIRCGWTVQTAWRAIGHKALAINLSDLAAMGQVAPQCALVTMGFNGDISVDSVDNMYRGLRLLADLHNCALVGGDCVRSDKSIISITCLGNLVAKSPWTRKGAKVGHILMASGPLGRSSAGLKILERQRKLRTPYEKSLVDAHLKPIPRLDLGQSLQSVDVLASSALDTSDDLLSSLRILRQSSGIGLDVDLDRLPVARDLARWCGNQRDDPWRHIVYGGEDYQILFTVPEKSVGATLQRIPGSYAFGRVVPKGRGLRLEKDGRRFKPRGAGFEHFE